MKTKNKYRIYPKTGQEYHFLSALKAFDPNATITKDGDTLVVDTYLSEFDIKFTSVLRVEHYLQITLKANISSDRNLALTLKEIQDTVQRCIQQSPVAYSHSYTLKSKRIGESNIRETNVNLLHVKNLHTIQASCTETTKMYIKHVNNYIDTIGPCGILDYMYPIIDVVLDDDCEIVLVYNG